jgi:hypothetical protein
MGIAIEIPKKKMKKRVEIVRIFVYSAKKK